MILAGEKLVMLEVGERTRKMKYDLLLYHSLKEGPLWKDGPNCGN